MGLAQRQGREPTEGRALRPEPHRQCPGQERERRGGAEPGRRDHTTPAEPLLKAGEQYFGQPFVRNREPAIPGERERIAKRQSLMRDDPPADRDVREGVAVVEQRMRTEKRDAVEPSRSSGPGTRRRARSFR
jgi:hypothetical protein